MGYETIEPDVWKPENDGDAVEGILIAKKENVGPNESKAYYLEFEGKQKMVWGTTVLDSRMDLVNVGDKIRITFKGTKDNTKGQPTKIFKVERDVSENVVGVKTEDLSELQPRD